MAARLSVPAAAAALLAAFRLSAEVPLANPGIPSEESYVYTRTTGKKVETVAVKWTLKQDQAVTYYEVETRSPESESLMRMDTANLFTRASESTSRTPDSAIRRTTTILESTANPRPDAVTLAGYESMTWALRGFPFGKVGKAKLDFVGSQSGGFEFEFVVAGKETVTSGGRAWECWKATIGLGGIFAAFGRTTLWYSVAAPNVLVKSEGLAGPPGSPTVVLELKSYVPSGKPWSGPPSGR